MDKILIPKIEAPKLSPLDFDISLNSPLNSPEFSPIPTEKKEEDIIKKIQRDILNSPKVDLDKIDEQYQDKYVKVTPDELKKINKGDEISERIKFDDNYEALMRSTQTDTERYLNTAKNFGVAASSSFIGGLAAIPNIIGSTINVAGYLSGRDKPISEFFNVGWDSGLNKTLFEFSNEVAENNRNYKSNWSKENWIRDMIPFFGDGGFQDIVASSGYTVGAMAEAFLTGNIGSVISKGTKLAGLGGRISKYLNNPAKLDKILSLFKAINKEDNVRKVIGEVGYLIGKGIEEAPQLYRMYAGSHFESAFEGLEGAKRFEEEAIQKYKENNFGMLPDQKTLENIKSTAQEIGDMRYGLNLAVLMIPNYLQMGALLKTFPGAEKFSKKVFGENTLGEIVSDSGKFSVKKTKDIKLNWTPEGKVGKFLKNAAEKTIKYGQEYSKIPLSFSEGMEEYMQYIIDEYSNSLYKGVYMHPETSIKTGEYISEMFKTIADKGLNKEAIQSFLMGSIGGGIQQTFNTGYEIATGSNRLKNKIAQNEIIASKLEELSKSIFSKDSMKESVTEEDKKMLIDILSNSLNQNSLGGTLEEKYNQALSSLNSLSVLENILKSESVHAQRWYYNIKDRHISQILHDVVETGKQDVFKDHLSQIASSPVKVINQLYNIDINEQTRDHTSFVNDVLDKLNKIENISKTIKFSFNDDFKDPLTQIKYSKYKRELSHMKFMIDRQKERRNGLMSPKINSLSKFLISDYSELENRINTLKLVQPDTQDYTNVQEELKRLENALDLIKKSTTYEVIENEDGEEIEVLDNVNLQNIADAYNLIENNNENTTKTAYEDLVKANDIKIIDESLSNNSNTIKRYKKLYNDFNFYLEENKDYFKVLDEFFAKEERLKNIKKEVDKEFDKESHKTKLDIISEIIQIEENDKLSKEEKKTQKESVIQKFKDKLKPVEKVKDNVVNKSQETPDLSKDAEKEKEKEATSVVDKEKLDDVSKIINNEPNVLPSSDSSSTSQLPFTLKSLNDLGDKFEIEVYNYSDKIVAVYSYVLDKTINKYYTVDPNYPSIKLYLKEEVLLGMLNTYENDMSKWRIVGKPDLTIEITKEIYKKQLNGEKLTLIEEQIIEKQITDRDLQSYFRKLINNETGNNNENISSSQKTTLDKINSLIEDGKKAKLIKETKDKESHYSFLGKLYKRVSNFIGDLLDFTDKDKVTNIKNSLVVGNYFDVFARMYFKNNNLTIEEFQKALKEKETKDGKEQFTKIEVEKIFNESKNKFKQIQDDIKKQLNDNNLVFITDEIFVHTDIKLEEGWDGVAGTLDMVVVDSKGIVHIYDFKTKAENDSRYPINKDKIEKPFSKKQKSDKEKWTDQQTAYSIMLEQTLGYKPNINIVVIPVSYKKEKFEGDFKNKIDVENFNPLPFDLKLAKTSPFIYTLKFDENNKLVTTLKTPSSTKSEIEGQIGTSNYYVNEGLIFYQNEDGTLKPIPNPDKKDVLEVVKDDIEKRRRFETVYVEDRLKKEADLAKTLDFTNHRDETLWKLLGMFFQAITEFTSKGKNYTIVKGFSKYYKNVLDEEGNVVIVISKSGLEYDIHNTSREEAKEILSHAQKKGYDENKEKQINDKYDKELESLNQQNTQKQQEAELEAKKADIERRRQEELSNTGLYEYDKKFKEFQTYGSTVREAFNNLHEEVKNNPTNKELSDFLDYIIANLVPEDIQKGSDENPLVQEYINKNQQNIEKAAKSTKSKISKINAKYDAELATLKSKTATDIEAKKADIERRIQKEIKEENLKLGEKILNSLDYKTQNRLSNGNVKGGQSGWKIRFNIKNSKTNNSYYGQSIDKEYNEKAEKLINFLLEYFGSKEKANSKNLQNHYIIKDDSGNEREPFKHLAGGEIGESDFTIYIGSADDVLKFISDIKLKFPNILELITTGNLGDDTQIDDLFKGRIEGRHIGFSGYHVPTNLNKVINNDEFSFIYDNKIVSVKYDGNSLSDIYVYIEGENVLYKGVFDKKLKEKHPLLYQNIRNIIGFQLYGKYLTGTNDKFLSFIENTSDFIEPLFLDKDTIKKQLENLSYSEKINKLIELGILTSLNVDGKLSNDINDVHLGWTVDRPIVFMKLGNDIVPFYRSSKGTGGKEKNRWYPFFGFGTDGWVIKGTVPEMERYYDNPLFKLVGDILTEEINYEGGLDLQKGNLKDFHPLFSKGEKSLNSKQINLLLYQKETIDINNLNQGFDKNIQYNKIKTLLDNWNTYLSNIKNKNQSNTQDVVPEKKKEIVDVIKEDIEKRRQEKLIFTFGKNIDVISSGRLAVIERNVYFTPKYPKGANRLANREDAEKLVNEYIEINAEYDKELAKELYKEMESGKMITEFTPDEQKILNKYNTPELRKSVEEELEKLEENFNTKDLEGQEFTILYFGGNNENGEFDNNYIKKSTDEFYFQIIPDENGKTGRLIPNTSLSTVNTIIQNLNVFQNSLEFNKLSFTPTKMDILKEGVVAKTNTGWKVTEKAVVNIIDERETEQSLNDEKSETLESNIENQQLESTQEIEQNEDELLLNKENENTGTPIPPISKPVSSVPNSKDNIIFMQNDFYLNDTGLGVLNKKKGNEMLLKRRKFLNSINNVSDIDFKVDKTIITLDKIEKQEIAGGKLLKINNAPIFVISTKQDDEEIILQEYRDLRNGWGISKQYLQSLRIELKDNFNFNSKNIVNAKNFESISGYVSLFNVIEYLEENNTNKLEELLNNLGIEKSYLDLSIERQKTLEKSLKGENVKLKRLLTNYISSKTLQKSTLNSNYTELVPVDELPNNKVIDENGNQYTAVLYLKILYEQINEQETAFSNNADFRNIIKEAIQGGTFYGSIPESLQEEIKIKLIAQLNETIVNEKGEVVLANSPATFLSNGFNLIFTDTETNRPYVKNLVSKNISLPDTTDLVSLIKTNEKKGDVRDDGWFINISGVQEQLNTKFEIYKVEYNNFENEKEKILGISILYGYKDNNGKTIFWRRNYNLDGVKKQNTIEFLKRKIKEDINKKFNPVTDEKDVNFNNFLKNISINFVSSTSKKFKTYEDVVAQNSHVVKGIEFKSGSDDMRNDTTYSFFHDRVEVVEDSPKLFKEDKSSFLEITTPTVIKEEKVEQEVEIREQISPELNVENESELIKFFSTFGTIELQNMNVKNKEILVFNKSNFYVLEKVINNDENMEKAFKLLIKNEAPLHKLKAILKPKMNEIYKLYLEKVKPCN